MTSPTNATSGQTVSAYLVARDAATAIAFYTRAFGAHEEFRLVEPSGKIGHAELRMGTSRVMISDEYPDFGAVSAATLGGSPIKLHLTVDDADAVMRHAVAAGGTELRPVKLQFHGHRGGMLLDPFGLCWFISTPVEAVSPEELQSRFTAALGG